MLKIDLRRIGAVAILDCTGTVDIDAAIFIEAIATCFDNGYRDILCNFESVTFIDYAGLSVIAVGYKEVVNKKGRLKFENVPAHIHKLFSMVHLDEVFEIYFDESRAIASFEEDRTIAEIQKKQLRRRFKRLPLEIQVDFKSCSKDEQFEHGRLLNISGVGLLVFSQKTYPLGEVLAVRLPLMPSPGLLNIEAKVVWLVQKDLQPHIYPGMGLEFHNLDSETQRKIVEFVERNLPLSCSTED